MLLQTRGTQLRARVAVQLVTGMGGKDICVHVSCVCLGVGRGLRRGWREGGRGIYPFTPSPIAMWFVSFTVGLVL